MTILRIFKSWCGGKKQTHADWQKESFGGGHEYFPELLKLLKHIRMLFPTSQVTTFRFTVFSLFFFLPGNCCCKWNCATIHQKPFFLTDNIHEAENHVFFIFYWFKNRGRRWGFYNVKMFGAKSPAFLNVIDFVTETRRQNGAKNACNFQQIMIFWDSGTVPFFSVLEGLLGKMVS